MMFLSAYVTISFASCENVTGEIIVNSLLLHVTKQLEIVRWNAELQERARFLSTKL